jgi:hypothetical protein
MRTRGERSYSGKRPCRNACRMPRVQTASMLHHPTHWIAVAIVAGLALIAFEASGDQPSMGSDAVFQGRPALAGAQGGLGAQAGLPQGGLAIESRDDMKLRPPRIILEQREVNRMGQGRIVERVVEVDRGMEPLIAAANTDVAAVRP